MQQGWKPPITFNCVHGTIQIVHGDITKVCVDVIVNAANSEFRGGGGVDAAIRKAMVSPPKYRSTIPVGEAIIDEPGLLNCDFVLHAVGPVYEQSTASSVALINVYKRTLILADRTCKARSIAFPSISTGVYGYPLEEAIPIACTEILAVLDGETKPLRLNRVLIVCFDERTYQGYVSYLATGEVTLPALQNETKWFIQKWGNFHDK